MENSIFQCSRIGKLKSVVSAVFVLYVVSRKLVKISNWKNEVLENWSGEVVLNIIPILHSSFFPFSRRQAGSDS